MKQLASAYSALAAELTRTEIKSVGGYTLGRIIGEGTFGKVRLGVHRLTGTRVAIKQVPKSIPSTSSDPCSPLSLLTREIHHHRRLRHPHVLSLYELIATESSIYLVTELCAGGELFDYLVEKGRLSLSETRRVFGQLVLGIAYLHAQGVVHRDLKLENVLLDERVNVKIADLGFGREFEKGKWMDTWVGTLGYCAPEVVAGKKYLGEEVDIWSLGVIFYALVTGSLPFDDDDEGVMKEMILKCDYEIPAWLDEDAADLIRNVLVLDPLRRISVKQILSHSFFTRPSPTLTRRPTFSRSHSFSSSLSSHQITSGQLVQDEFEHPPAILEQEEGGPISSPDVGFLAREQNPGEGSSSAGTSFKDDGRHAVDYSDETSQSSYFGSGSQARTEASSPMTSQDGREEEAISAVKAGKRRAVEPETEGDGRVRLPRNESQSTLRCGESDEQVTGTATRSRLPTNLEEASLSPSLSRASAPNSPVPIPLASIDSPALRRNVSTSSSMHSLPISHHGASTPHARTPVRTKRRSIGSIISERLVSLEEEPSASPSAFLPPVDYLSLMLVEYQRESPLSSPAEKELLDHLTTLGFDTGQMVHSVTTSACDSSSATWWMLKRKMDEKEAARLEDEAISASIAHEGRKASGELSRSSSLNRPRSVRRASSADRQPEETVLGMPERRDSDGEDPTPTRNLFSTGSPSIPPPARVSLGPSPAQVPPSDDRLEYFLGQHDSGAPPASHIEYFPTIDPGSPTRRRTKSRDELPSSPRGGPSNLMPLDSPLELSPTRGKNEDESRNRRSRSGSVTLLARATSAFGSSLSLKTKEEGGNVEDSPTSVSGSLFRRKSSVPKEEEANGAARTPPAIPSSLTSSPQRTLSNSPFRDPSTPPRPAVTRPATSPEPSPSVSLSNSIDTFDTISSSTSSSRPRPASAHVSSAPNGGPSKKGTKGSQLLANLKFWFGDAQRKRNKRGSPARGGEGHPYGAMNVGATALVRSHSLGSGYRVAGATGPNGYVASPLRRPLAASRRSSNASIAPLSRRSSVSSAHRGPDQLGRPSLAHHRRRSDSSRTSISGGDHSRPQSIHSITGIASQPADAPSSARRNRHSKAPSTSSAGSFGKDAVYRRPPTTTTVRRRHTSHGRHNHRRSASGASSIRTHRSSASSMGEGGSDDGFDDGGEAPILEEDETEDRDYRGEDVKQAPVDEMVRAEARLKALRKLSGDFSTIPPINTSSRSSSRSSSPALSASRHGSRPPLLHHSSSRASSRSDHSSSSRPHAAHATFSAHKATHLFGSPLQPHAHVAARKTAPPVRPPLRDVFASKSTIGDSDWVDEDELDGYGGGLGQAGTGVAVAADGGSSLATVDEGRPPSGAGNGDSPVAEKTFGMAMFEGRYAGLASATAPAPAGRGLRTNSTARATVVIEEEEEEE
ncbi:hypothetical protein JCM10212_000031 [Sporobolomyces blumeae]